MSDPVGNRIDLSGKTVLVTGGSRGIGRAICLRLASASAFTALTYVTNETAAAETLELVRANGGQGVILRADVRSDEDVGRALKDVLDDRGAVHGVVNNAAVSKDGLLGRMSDADWNEVIDTSLTGAFRVCRAAAKSMIRQRAGRIINIASTAGEAGNGGQANYSAAKAGLIGFTKSLARELAPRNILVNAVSPGIINEGMSRDLTDKQMQAITEHIPLGRAGTADDVAAAVLFLCSDMSAYITGQVIRVNGGLYM